MKPRRIEILGVPVDCITMDEAVDFAESMIKGQHPCAILAVNPEKVVRAQQDNALLTQLRNSALVIPDGIGVVFATRLLGGSCTERVPGSELMPLLCQRAALKGYKVFLFGASPDVVSRTAQILQQQCVGLKIVGAQHGYVKEDDMPAMIAKINSVQPDILFVALGSPKQEMWIARYLPELKVNVCQGVGGTFDVVAGRVKRAPLLFRLIHLEWFYRLLSQPSRIFRQTALPIFAYQVLRSKFTRRPDLQPAFSVPTAPVSRSHSDSGKSDQHREKAA
ncbi:MAG: WecB/TagA/CpsF family glycosyltransferase [Nitrospira sp.]|nr:WecB/TagA/CpsF family glycosyltransferase [Nitrospira sp.]MBS0153152.1 WecB/TagA/CpsF family glycosyltransferase [Nitrospira sp.]MBS0168447.1 WecB/TagA/CpsF family glycosyltransferase [Nitrospira sp.]